MAEMDPEQVTENITGLWRQVGALSRDMTLFGVRFDRVDRDIADLKADVSELKADVSELKGDVAGLKGDVAELKGQVNRLELSFERGFTRVDAQFERLVALIQRDERK